MRRKILAAALALAAIVPAGAHHSAAMFDHTRLVLLEGKVISFSYLNPHSWISVMAAVDGKGEPARWDIEATSPNQLARIGIEKDTLKPGDKVTIGSRPLRDGRNGGSLVFVVTADGKALGADPKELGLDARALVPK
ncbi:MAG: DUF6152 family protein [Steroidobacteraceae bacterium]